MAGLLHVLACKLSSVNGIVGVPTLWSLVHLVLGAWLTVWLLLWRVVEPCRGHGGRTWGTAAYPAIVGK